MTQEEIVMMNVSNARLVKIMQLEKEIVELKEEIENLKSKVQYWKGRVEK